VLVALSETVTFANRLGVILGPAIVWLRDVGFFEWYVYVPFMTILSVGIFRYLLVRLGGNGTFSDCSRTQRLLWSAAYYGLCFLITNGTAVGLKTLIVEELDYSTRVWFEAYVGPLHFYIALVALVYVALLIRNQRLWPDRLGAIFVQLGLLAGYLVGIYRVVNEPMSFDEPTAGLSGIVLCIYFAVYNFDLYSRFLKTSLTVEP
tara:strand:- start:584 stop:1198 length:615 start_codon:yes stop_codon:yes gene_type:complete